MGLSQNGHFEWLKVEDKTSMEESGQNGCALLSRLSTRFGFERKPKGNRRFCVGTGQKQHNDRWSGYPLLTFAPAPGKVKQINWVG